MENSRNELMTVDQINKIYSNISSMVQFGESKNGVLLGVNLAILYNVALKTLSFSDFLHSALSYVALGFFIVSTFILFYSIFPKIKATKVVNWESGKSMQGTASSSSINIKATKGSNPLFFGAISQMDLDKYQKICSDMTEKEAVEHYAELIHINAGIASRKFNEFKKAVLYAMPSYVAFAILYVIR